MQIDDAKLDDTRMKLALDTVNRGIMTIDQAESAFKVDLSSLRPKEIEYENKDNGFFERVPIVDSAGNVKLDQYGAAKYKEVPDYYSMAHYLRTEKHFKFNDAFSFIYSDGKYDAVTREQLNRIIVDLSLEKCQPHQIESFAKIVRAICFKKREDFKENFDLINLNNGYLKISTGEFFAHSPNEFFKYKLPHDYDPSAKCPEWIKFITETFEDDQELVDLMQELFGYYIYGGKPFLHKATLFFGDGREGKSTVLEVISELVGKQNISNIPVQNLNKPFSVVMADGKKLNICGEGSNGQIDSESFKLAVGGERLIAAHKGQPEYEMDFYAKIIFASNKLPVFKDTTAGAYEKLCIIPFNRYIKEEDRIGNFAERFLFKEMSGILNWSLAGLSRLLERGRLPKAKKIEDALEEYRIESDSVYDWFTQHVESSNDPSSFVLIKDWHGEYKRFCEKNGRSPMKLIGFSRKVCKEARRQYGSKITSSRSGSIATKIKLSLSI